MTGKGWLAGALALLPMTPLAAEEVIVSDMQSPVWSFYGDVKVKPVDAEKAPGGKMLRADVQSKGANYWDSAASSEPLKSIEEGQIIILGFFARAGSNDGPVWVNANIGQISEPYDAAIIARIDIGPDEMFYCLEGPSKISARDGKSKVTLHLGGEKQKVDLGPFVVTARDAGDAPSSLPCDKVIPSW